MMPREHKASDSPWPRGPAKPPMRKWLSGEAQRKVIGQRERWGGNVVHDQIIKGAPCQV